MTTASAMRTEDSEPTKTTYVRFGVSPRIEHLVLMVSFIMLSLTGLAEKYFQAGWAQWVIYHLGGIDGTRVIHRIFAFAFVSVAVYHLGFLVYHFLVRRGPASLLPTVKDARDTITYLRYCLGLASSPPQCDRYDFRQKFEYWGIVFGGIIMILSGGILMFPIFVTRFLPGGFVPAAKEFHSNEAMLALLTIVVWHFYSAHLRPGIFPADTSIFTGRVSKRRMMEEHPLEYQRLSQEAGTQDTAPQKDHTAKAS